MALGALPAAAISTVIYGYASGGPTEPSFAEGAIVYFVPALIIFLGGMIYSAVAPSAEGAKNPSRSLPLATQPDQVEAPAVVITRTVSPDQKSPKKHLDGIMRLRIVFAALIWLISLGIWGLAVWGAQSSVNYDTRKLTMAASSECGSVVGRGKYSTYALDPVYCSTELGYADWTECNKQNKCREAIRNQSKNREALARSQNQRNITIGAGFLLTLLPVLLFWLVGSVVGWVWRGFRQN